MYRPSCSDINNSNNRFHHHHHHHHNDRRCRRRCRSIRQTKKKKDSWLVLLVKMMILITTTMVNRLFGPSMVLFPIVVVVVVNGSSTTNMRNVDNNNDIGNNFKYDASLQDAAAYRDDDNNNNGRMVQQPPPSKQQQQQLQRRVECDDNMNEPSSDQQQCINNINNNNNMNSHNNDKGDDNDEEDYIIINTHSTSSYDDDDDDLDDDDIMVDFDEYVINYEGRVEYHPSYYGMPQVILIDLFTEDDRMESIQYMEQIDDYMARLRRTTDVFDYYDPRGEPKMTMFRASSIIQSSSLVPSSTPSVLSPSEVPIVLDLPPSHELYVSSQRFRHNILHHCRNKYRLCVYRAAILGHCDVHSEYRSSMIEFCSPACQTCNVYWREYVVSNNDDDDDDDDEDEVDIENDHHTASIAIMPKPAINREEYLLTEFGVPQNLAAHGWTEHVRTALERTSTYMTGSVFKEMEYHRVVGSCLNRHRDCTAWAAMGKCQDEVHKTFMQYQCAPACLSCESVDKSQRCPIPSDTPLIWGEAGDLNAFFGRIVTTITVAGEEQHHDFGPIRTLSRPIDSNPEYDVGGSTNDNGQLEGPWVITIENFLSDEECRRLIEVGDEEGFERSTKVGRIKVDGIVDRLVSSYRASTIAWCPDDCYDNDPILRPVFDQIEQLTAIPYVNSEWLQLIRYEHGERLSLDHDYIDHEAYHRPQGPRILTMYLFLNDVDEGGETIFPSMNITVTPQRGMALVWPNVLNDNPMEIDPRTRHETLPVKKGIMYGANFWAHQRNFKDTFHADCV